MLSDNIYKRQQNKITKKCTKWYTIQLWKQKIICLDEPRTFQKNKLHSNTVANINIRCPCRRNVTYMIRPCTAVLIRHEIMEKSVHANALCCWTITPLTLKNSCGNSHTSKITLLHLNPVTWTLLGMIDQLTKITLLNNKSLKIFQLNKYEKKGLKTRTRYSCLPITETSSFHEQPMFSQVTTTATTLSSTSLWFQLKTYVEKNMRAPKQ